MARIKKFAPEQKLSSFQTFIVDDNPNSDYFRITEFKDTFTGGKNGFLIEGSEYLKESTEIKIELLDVAGNPIYFEPGNGIPEYYEGISKLVAVYIYEDTPIGLGKITVLGELKEYDDNGVKRQIPNEWKGAYNVKWERTFQVNKNLANEDKVRFYRRPKVTIDEVVKPIFSGNPPSVTQIGSVDGIPLVPTQNTNLSNFTLPTSYRLKVNTGNKWTGSIEGQTISFDNITYSPTIDEVVNETELIVSPPYSVNNLVQPFINEDYSLTFPYIEGVGDLATALTGSFAKINITDMKTFVGDAARVKVYRRSQSNLTDYEFVQEIQLESNELLRDVTTFSKKEENYGIFTQGVLDSYWVTSSNDMVVEFNQNFLYNSAKLSSSPNNYFYTSQSFSIQNGVEYTLDLNVRVSGSINSTDYLKVFLSGSTGGSSVSTPITTINSSNTLLQKTNFTENIIANSIETASLYFEVSGSDWYVNNVSLKASQETSFSPDEITFIQQVPKTLVTETFDYRFEFYDINNNFIPVRVETTKTFVGGNTNLFNKSIEITPDNLYFSFDSASNPANALPPTIINFDVQTTLVTGSITYTSGAYDFFGNLIPEASYSVGGYPGYLTNWDVDSGRQPFLRVQDFTGSRDDIIVQFIRYTGEVEGVSDTFVITRVEDGKGGVSFEIVPYRGLQIKNKESKTLEVQAVRVDGINRIDLRDGLSRGFSDAKLHLLSSSLDGVDVVNTYVSLSQAITNPNFIEGISAGETGSGEIDYNAIFTRDAIDNELTLFLMDGPTSESILTSVILTDLKDGLNPGLVTSTAEQFNIKYEPRRLSPFNPTKSIVTASFQRRGTTLNPLTASLEVLPSSSIEPKTELPQFYMFYTTGAFDDTITVAVTDYLGNPISNGVPGITLDETSGTPIPFYQAVQTKQLNFEFTYTEPITSASVTANKSFFITPDGLPGQNSIVIDIDPQPVALGSNHKGEIYNYELANTDIQVTQGDLFLINTASGDPGTFTTRSITPTNIQFTTLDGDSTTTMSLAGFESMSALSASIKYDFDIYPYFTSSLITASKTQKFTKVVEGAGAIEVTLDPTAVALNADESGWISNYSLASTEVFIKQNDEFLIYDPTNAGTPGTFLTASISASGINFSEVSSSQRDSSLSGDEILHFKGFSGVERTQPSASVTYNFRVYPYALKAGVAGVPTIVSKTQTFSKVNDGSKARKVSLTTNSDTIVYDGDSIKVAPVGSVFLTATSYNTTGSAYFEFLDSDGGVIGGGSSTTTTVNVDNYLPGPGSSSFFSVNLRDGNASGPIADNDSVTVSGVQEGSTAYSVALTNGASSVTVERDGTIYFTNSGTLIRAYKGGTELQYVEEYNEEAVDPITFLPIGTFGQFSASVYDISPFLTQGTLRDGKEIVSKSISPTEDELYASASGISTWNLPQDNTQGFITYKIDFENGRATQFIDQTFSTVFEGATGPGVVVRGEWTGSIEYIYTPERRDVVVVRSGSEGDTHYFATTDTLVRSGSQPFTTPPSYSVSPETEQGDYVQGNWEYLGQQEMFVAAKIAIFEESFVENTINVGQPPSNDPNANIVIAGSGSQPFIAVGQSGIQGFRQEGIFMGIDNNGGVDGNTKQPVLSLKSETVGGQYKSLEWDGESLTIRGAIRQTSAGVVEPSLRGTWASGTEYYPQDLVQYLGETWSSDTQHTSTDDTNASTGRPGSGPWTIAAGAGKGVNLIADSYIIAYDAAGGSPSPSGTMTLTANSSNFVDGYFKFTGGGAVFTDETSFTDGTGANTDTATFTIPTSYFSTPLQFRVGVAEGDQNEKVSDTITITAVQPGADSTPMYFITSTAGGTQIKNGSGTITLQAQQSDSTGLSNLASPSAIKIYSGSNLITTISGVTGTDYNPTIDASAIFGTMYLTLKDGSNTYDTITLLDVTDGLGGGSFISPNLKSTRNPVTNNYTPSFLSLTASFYDTSGTEYQKAVQIIPNFDSGTDYMYYNTNGSINDSEISLVIDNGDGTVFSGTGIGNKLPTKDVVVTATFTDPATSQTSTMVETVYIISDGADGLDAITVVLSNSAHTLAADSGGTVTSYAGSGTTISVYEGINQLNHDGTGTSNGTFKIVAVPTNITVGSITDDGNDALVGNHNSMTGVSASIQYQITGSRVSGSSFTSQAVQTLTKAIAGIAGTNAKTIRLSATNQAFVVASDGSVSPNYITLSVNKQNTTATTNWSTSPSVTLYDAPTGGNTTTTGDTVYLRKADFGANTAVTITATADGLSDEITIVKVAEGTNGITILNSNQSHTVPASSAGAVSSFAGSGTKIEVYEGATKLDYDGGIPPSDGAFSIGNVVITPTGNFTIDSTPDEGANYIEYGDGTAMDNATDVVTIRYGITGSRANGEEFRADTFQTIAKSKAGENGTSGTSGAAGADGQAAGIVYAGEWTEELPDGSTPTAANKVAYLGEDDLKYVVKYETGGNTYWVTAVTHRYAGAWSSGQEYILNDIVSYLSTYWRANSAVTGVGTTNPPNTNASWDSLGAASNLVPGTLQLGGVAAFDSFGAEFTSVATDILFAQDVYADKTINVGAKNASAVIALNSDAGNSNANPYISIGQGGTQGFGQDGIFLGFDSGTAGVTGLPKLSLYADASDSAAGYVEFDGTDFTFSGGTVTGSIVQGGLLLIGFDSNSQEHNFRVSSTGDIVAKGSSNAFSGFISASSGNIGGWGINSAGISKFETDAGSIVLSSEDIEIAVNDISGAQRFSANASDTLPSVTGGSLVTAASPTGNVSDDIGLGSTGTGTKNATQYLISSGLTVGAGAGGKYKLEATHVQNNNAFVEAVGAGSQATISVQVQLRTAVGPGSGSLIARTASITAGSTGYDEGGLGYESVIKGTKISLPNGETKNVEDLKVKDTILAWNVETNQYESAKIKRVKGRVVNKVYRVTVGDNVVEVSDTHGFFYSPGWKIKVTDLRVGEDEVYVKEGNSFVKRIVDSVELISKEIEVYSLEIPTLRNYISNGIVSHNYAVSVPMSGGVALLPSTTFTKTIDNLSVGTYYAQWKIDYYLAVAAADTQYSAEMSYSVYTVGANYVTLRPQTSGTFVNGGGFAVIKDSTNYFRIASDTSKAFGANIGYIGDLQGGLAVDKMYGAGGFSAAPGVGGAYNVAGHPYLIKGAALISFPDGSTTSPRAGTSTIRMSAGNFTSVTGTVKGTYTINYTSVTAAGTNTSGKWASVIATGQRASTAGVGFVANMGITQNSPSGGSGSVTIYVNKPQSSDLENLASLQLLILH